MTLRYKSRLHHIGVGRPYRGERITLLVAGANVRILSADGKLIRALTIDPTRNTRAKNDLVVYNVSRHLSPMSCDITVWAVGDSNPHALAGTSPSSWRVCLFRHSDESALQLSAQRS